MEAIYRGARVGSKGKLVHLYDIIPVETGKEVKQLYFKKKLPGWHRIGDVLELEEVKEGSFKVKGDKPLRHIESAAEEADDIAARQLVASEGQAKKLASQSDLEDAIQPLRRAYLRASGPQRAALVAWTVRLMMGWGG